ncbi:MAG: hypothetical protein DMD96_31680 [Candidatus Rokuibacteriota bacterium]|nr:MAG: hypothetical protein DMD96_31680 [Candidatus Rokubacteria bacterium]
MTVDEAIELIFTRLCDAYTRNPDATLTAEDLGAGIPNDIFAAALRELRGPADDQDLRIRYVEGNRTRAALGTSWRGRCDDRRRR